MDLFMEKKTYNTGNKYPIQIASFYISVSLH